MSQLELAARPLRRDVSRLVVPLLILPGLAFALGMYLPMDLNSPLVIGAFLAWVMNRSSSDEKRVKARNEKGTLIASGFIVGESLFNVALSALIVGLDDGELDWLRRSLGSDAKAWDDEFGCARDVSQLGVERNLLRYRPVPVIIRATADAALHHTIRAVAAGMAAGSVPAVSTPVVLSAAVLVQFWDTPWRLCAAWGVAAAWALAWAWVLIALMRVARQGQQAFALTRRELGRDWADLKEGL